MDDGHSHEGTCCNIVPMGIKAVSYDLIYQSDQLQCHHDQLQARIFVRCTSKFEFGSLLLSEIYLLHHTVVIMATMDNPNHS